MLPHEVYTIYKLRGNGSISSCFRLDIVESLVISKGIEVRRYIQELQQWRYGDPGKFIEYMDILLITWLTHLLRLTGYISGNWQGIVKAMLLQRVIRKEIRKPMTTLELFCKIKDILEEKDKLSDILDYSLGTSKPAPITNYEFGWGNNLDYGNSEGIYLDLWIKYCKDDKICTKSLGTFKTLRNDDKAMRTMATLLADFIIEGTAYVNTNPDDFI